MYMRPRPWLPYSNKYCCRSKPYHKQTPAHRIWISGQRVDVCAGWAVRTAGWASCCDSNLFHPSTILACLWLSWIHVSWKILKTKLVILTDATCAFPAVWWTLWMTVATQLSTTLCGQEPQRQFGPLSRLMQTSLPRTSASVRHVAGSRWKVYFLRGCNI